MADEHGNPREPQIIIQADQMAGVWANFARVSHSPYEFTIDFARLEFKPMPEGAPDGIVVARVSLSPLLVQQLVAALNDNWSKWAALAMPQEVFGNGPGQQEEDSGGRPDAPSADE